MMDTVKDKTEDVFKLIAKLKEQKIKGKIIIHLDGSGTVPKAEVHREI